MTGRRVAGLLDGLGLDAAVLAGLVGAAPSTVYRWRSAGDDALRIEPGSLRLLHALEEVTGREPDQAARRALGAELTRAFRLRGPLYAIYTLLGRFFADPVGADTSAAIGVDW